MKTPSILLLAALIAVSACAIYYHEKSRLLRVELNSKDDAKIDFIKGVKWASDRYLNGNLYTLPDGQWQIQAQFIRDSVFVSSGTLSIDCHCSNHFHYIIDCGFYSEVIEGKANETIP